MVMTITLLSLTLRVNKVLQERIKLVREAKPGSAVCNGDATNVTYCSVREKP